jgi:hypothetical protein
MDAGSIESHREHGTDQTWSSCWSCMTARRQAKAASPRWSAVDHKAARSITRRFPADGYVAAGTCRRCGTYCYGDCRS